MAFNFTSCGQNLNVGPTQDAADAFYRNSQVRVKIVGDGIQQWVVPYDGVYTIEAAGAGGHTMTQYRSGKGALLSSTFQFSKKTVIYILVGQSGRSPGIGWGGSGGGASFVVVRNSSSRDWLVCANDHVSPLLVAGGGGGAGDTDNTQVSKSGGDGSSSFQEEGAGSYNEKFSTGGAGYRTVETQGLTHSFLNGGKGGKATYSQNTASYGGFGCGGCSWNAGGGGGGYRGGNAGLVYGGGLGGYSLQTGEKRQALSGFNQGNGYVNISLNLRLNNCQSMKPKFQYESSCLLFIIQLGFAFS